MQIARNNYQTSFFRLFFTLLFVWSQLSGCSDSGQNVEMTGGSGGLALQVNWPSDNNDIHAALYSPSAISSCSELGIVSVQATVFDDQGEKLIQSDMWDCEDQQGLITGIPAGTAREVVLFCYGPDEEILFRGEKVGVTILADQVNDGGEVDVVTFVAEKQSPAEDATVDKATLILEWQEVENASLYQVIISTQADLSDPLLDEEVAGPPFSPSGLADGVDYFWQVFAFDEEGYQGAGSPVRQFTTESDEPVVNNAPTVQILTPTDDQSFITGTSVSFSATATDQEDGDLSGDSLVWVSDLDGQIGTGTDFFVTDLSLGLHEITLTATDSGNATATAIVSINIVPDTSDTPPVANINYPADGTVFNEGDVIGFTGSGTDQNDVVLTGNQLEWQDAAGTILGFGETLEAMLPAGTNLITLIARDSNGNTADPITFTIIVNAPPQVSVTDPVDQDSFNIIGADQIFQGTADDPEDGPLSSGSLVWSSNVSGIFGYGQMVTLQNGVGAGLLPGGSHTITLTATDSYGAVSTMSVNIYVAGEIIVNITSHPDGFIINPWNAIDFIGYANDPEDGALIGTSLEWFDNSVSQNTGDTYSPLNGLAYGSHQIMLQATDSNANSAQTTITVLANSPPSGNIDPSLDGSTLSVTATTLFEFLNLSDEAMTSVSVVWSSDVDGVLGTGTPFDPSGLLSPGAHVITVIVTDEFGAQVVQSANINVV